MRKGVNPVKGGKPVVKEPCDHRVIIPLFIPHENDYFQDAYKIFEIRTKNYLQLQQPTSESVRMVFSRQATST